MKPEAGTAQPAVSLRVKASLLVLLALQNSLLDLLARRSRVLASRPGEEGEEAQGYARTSYVVVMESVKVFVAFMLLTRDRGMGPREAFGHFYSTTARQPIEVISPPKSKLTLHAASLSA